jgi:hypothetical protein
MQQNEIYNIPLPRGPGPNNQKQKGNERGIKYPGGLKMSDSSREHKISTGGGSGIDLDLTYKFLEYRSLYVRVRFEKPNNHARDSPLYPRYISALPTPQDCQPQPLVPNLAASTMARSRGGTGNKN